ncbi:unnamed protein product [Mesocestoides corti]|uniref:RH1 domain-containing protein n=1 Tax=Mesocestoides corti TaxID=53468 RepID=A0A158QSX1_MESCO|nr:unnamed protein product [Mesocestoides corti]
MAESHNFAEADIASSHFSNDGDVKIHQLTLDIYAEFEKILKSYGEQPLRTLVPLVANLLETLNDVSLQKDKIIAELDVLKDHHTILLSKHESLRADLKNMEEQLFSLEDELHDKRKRIEALKSSSASSKKLLEMKLKSATDHIFRLEERDKELQSTYANLRQRYGDLFRAHVDLMERLRISAEEPSDDASVPTSSSKLKTQVPVVASCSSTTGIRNPLMFISHKGDSPYDWGVHQRALENANEVLPDVTLDADGSPFSKLSADERYEELSISEEKSDSGEMGDSSPVPCGKKELAPDFNVSKEVSKLVKENNELEETKNALNVVIHDLLTKLEEQNSLQLLPCTLIADWPFFPLSRDPLSEKLQLNETLSQMQISRSSMQLHITQLEADNTRLRKELTDALNAQKELEMNQTPFSKRTRFTREEMAKVLMERNQLQEDICDLREELNWATSNLSEHENGNANASSSANKFLVFFSRLFRKPSRRSHSSVSFDTSTSGVTVNVDGSRSNIVKSLEFVQNSSHQKRDQAVAVPPNWAWVAVPIAAKPCLPQPVVMQSSGVSNTPPSTRKASAAAVPPSSRSPTRLPLPLPLYRRPFPEALSGRMQASTSRPIYHFIYATKTQRFHELPWTVGSYIKPHCSLTLQRASLLNRDAPQKARCLPTTIPLHPYQLCFSTVNGTVKIVSRMIDSYLIDSATCVYVDMGGFRPSGELLAGRSAFFDPEATSSHSSSNPSTDIAEAFSLSSELWVCLTGVVDAAVDWTPLAEQASADSSTHSEPKPVFHSQVVVVDANVPSRYIKSFSLLRSVVTCMAAVPGRPSLDGKCASLIPRPGLRPRKCEDVELQALLDEDSVRTQHELATFFGRCVIKSFKKPPYFFFAPSRLTGGAAKRDYDVLRLASATWDAIPFTKEAGGTSRSEALSEPLRPTTPPPACSEDEEHQSSFRTDNSLSSLRYFSTSQPDERVVDGCAEADKLASLQPQRDSAFDPDIPRSSSDGRNKDFYRVERQRFTKTASAAPNEGNPDWSAPRCIDSLNIPRLGVACSALTDLSNADATLDPVEPTTVGTTASMFTAQQTIWLGCQNGDIYLHSGVTAQQVALQTTRLPSAISAIRPKFEALVEVLSSIVDSRIPVGLFTSQVIHQVSFFCREKAVLLTTLGANDGDVIAKRTHARILSTQNRPQNITSKSAANGKLAAGATCLRNFNSHAKIDTPRHFSGRVFVGLANGHIVVFRRQTSPRRSATPTHSSLLASATACPDDDDGGSSCEASQVLAVTSTQGDCRRNQLSIEEELSAADAGGGNWDLSEAVVIRCGPTTQFGVKALVVVPSALTLWAACKNRILVIDTTNFQRLFTIDVASSMGSSVKCMSWIRDGVWVSLRTEPVVRLYNAFTYEPMQELDMAHVILETLGVPGSRQLAVSASVTALGASPDHLWVGTKGGHVACAPFKQKKESRLGCANTSPQSTPIRRASRGLVSPSFSQFNIINLVILLLFVLVILDSFEHFSPTNRTAQVDLSGISVSVYGHAEAVNFFALVSGPGATTSSSSSLAHTRLASSTPVNPTKTSPSSSATSAAASNSRFLMVSGGVGFVEYRDSWIAVEIPSPPPILPQSKKQHFSGLGRAGEARGQVAEPPPGVVRRVHRTANRRSRRAAAPLTALRDSSPPPTATNTA